MDESSSITIGCKFRGETCDNNCNSIIFDLPLLNGNETTRIIEDSISIWSVYFSIGSMIVFLFVAIILLIITWIPPIRGTKIAYCTLYLFLLCGGIMGFGILIGSAIFIATSDNLSDTPNCYLNTDVSDEISKLENTIYAQFPLFLFFCMFEIILIAIIIAHVFFDFSDSSSKQKPTEPVDAPLKSV